MDIDVGLKLHTLRVMHGWSQRQLAKRAGVTNSTISMIEQGRVSPSISSLKKVLDGIPMSLSDFFSLEFGRYYQAFYKADDLTSEALANSIVTRSLAQDDLEKRLAMDYSVYAPGADTGEDMLSSGRESLGFVVAGEVEITIGAETELLAAGEGFYIKAFRPHRIRNLSSADAHVVLATHNGSGQ